MGRPPFPEPSNKEREQWIKRYQSGESMNSISISTGRSYRWIRMWFKTWGVPLRGKAEANSLRWKRQHNRTS